MAAARPILVLDDEPFMLDLLQHMLAREGFDNTVCMGDGTAALYFRRDPKDKNKVIRTEADLGLTDGRWVVVASGVKEGDEVVVGGNYQLMLASSGAAPKGGHFHADGTFHEGKD